MMRRELTNKEEKTIAVYLCDRLEDMYFTQFEEACYHEQNEELVEKFYHKIQELRDIIQELYI